MKTPIVSFLKSYQEKSPVRMHMPGHKGAGILGFEGMDLTEIYGADELFAARYYAKMLKVKARNLRFLWEEMLIEALSMLLHF